MGTVSFATRRIRGFMAIATVGLWLAAPAHAQVADAPACRGVDYNRMILDIVHNLPKGGGYDRDHPELPVVASLEIAGRWEMLVRHGHPSHCTSATYSVFAHLAVLLQANRKINLNEVPRRTDDIRLLSDAGHDDWELVAITANSIAYLKRQIEEQPAARSTRKTATRAK